MKTLLITIASGFVLAFIGFVIWLIQQVLDRKANERSLKAVIASLKEEKSGLEEKIRNLEEKNITHKKQVPRDSLQFDTTFHYYKDDSGHLYCAPCYDDKGKLIHLKPCADPKYGWECPSCKNISKNPNYSSSHLPRQYKIDNPFRNL